MKVLKQVNMRYFPPDFMFELTKIEWEELVTICDRIPETMKHSYIPPFAFTEHGITMLSSVLLYKNKVFVSTLSFSNGKWLTLWKK